jgi:hypothetical protein
MPVYGKLNSTPVGSQFPLFIGVYLSWQREEWLNPIRRGVSHADCILNILGNYLVDMTKVFWVIITSLRKASPG